MIEQKLYIEVLELFDLIKDEDLFIQYKQQENKVLNDKVISSLINEYNFITNTLNNIDYEPFVIEQTKELDSLNEQLNNNNDYQHYLKMHQSCNDYLLDISSLIFKDIINITSEQGCCASK